MQQGKKSVTARIPKDLYDKCNQYYENMTDAVIAGLKLLCNTDVIDISDTTIKDSQNILQLELAYNEKLLDNHQQGIEEFKEQIQELKEDHKNEVNRLVDQLKEKDSQIKNLTTIT
jgi:hypothetical protein